MSWAGGLGWFRESSTCRTCAVPWREDGASLKAMPLLAGIGRVSYNPPMQGGVLRNIPNALSAYRLAMAPVLTGLALTGREKPFVILIVVSLITDIMDGLIARAFRLQSQFGA